MNNIYIVLILVILLIIWNRRWLMDDACGCNKKLKETFMNKFRKVPVCTH